MPKNDQMSKTKIHSDDEKCLIHRIIPQALCFHRRCELDGESHGEKRTGILANWSVDVCSVSHLGRFVG